jgi:hypothetical protein
MHDTELDYEVTEFLAHYGVKGMQWGKRRPIGPSGLIKKSTTANKGQTRRAKRVSKRDASNKRLASGKSTLKDKGRLALQANSGTVARALKNKESLGKAFAGQKNAQQQRLKTVAKGKGSKSDKARTLLRTSAKDVAVAGLSRQKVSAVTAKRLRGKRVGDK